MYVQIHSLRPWLQPEVIDALGAHYIAQLLEKTEILSLDLLLALPLNLLLLPLALDVLVDAGRMGVDGRTGGHDFLAVLGIAQLLPGLLE